MSYASLLFVAFVVVPPSRLSFFLHWLCRISSLFSPYPFFQSFNNLKKLDIKRRDNLIRRSLTSTFPTLQVLPYTHIPTLFLTFTFDFFCSPTYDTVPPLSKL